MHRASLILEYLSNCHHGPFRPLSCCFGRHRRHPTYVRKHNEGQVFLTKINAATKSNSAVALCRGARLTIEQHGAELRHAEPMQASPPDNGSSLRILVESPRDPAVSTFSTIIFNLLNLQECSEIHQHLMNQALSIPLQLVWTSAAVGDDHSGRSRCWPSETIVSDVYRWPRRGGCCDACDEVARVPGQPRH